MTRRSGLIFLSFTAMVLSAVGTLNVAYGEDPPEFAKFNKIINGYTARNTFTVNW